MLTYLIQETRPDVNGSRLVVGGGINSCNIIQLVLRKKCLYLHLIPARLTR